MTHRTSSATQAVSPPPHAAGAWPASMALFGSNSHRGAYLSPHKAEGAWRVVIVGDSMTYGQGLPHSKTLSQRLASHLNGTLPGRFVEGMSLGMCGACAFHALERVDDLALPLDPDVIIVALCCNDAYMLRGQPSTNEDIGQTWVAFRPQLEHALRRFSGRMRERQQKTVVLYFDRAPSYGSVSPATVLRDVCQTAGLPFIDGSEALAPYPYESVVVSEADGHLNALANDIVARQVTRFLGQQGWLPDAAPFSHPAWLDSMASLPDRLAASGVPPLLAGARALSVLDSKWMDRRNRQRQALATTYQRTRDDITSRGQGALEHLAWHAMGCWLTERHHPEGPLAFAEARLHELSTIVSILEYAELTGVIGQSLDDLSHVLGPDEGDAGALAATAAGARTRAAAALATVGQIAAELPADADGLSMELSSLRVLVTRVSGLLTMLDRSAARLSQLVDGATRHDSAEMLTLRRYAERSLRHGIERLAPWAERLPWERIRGVGTGWTVTSPVMTLELVIAADPGTELWPFSVGVESRYPFYQEASIHGANLIRDGRPHAYHVELPLMLLGDIQIFFSGPTVASGADPGPLRVYPATLTAPGLPPRAVSNRLTYVNHTATSVTFTYRSLFLFED